MREIKFRAWDKVQKKMLYQIKQEQFDDMIGFRFPHFEDEIPLFCNIQGCGIRTARRYMREILSGAMMGLMGSRFKVL